MDMTEEEKILNTYTKMYQAMIDKDIAALEALMEEDSILIHMSGMKQFREKFMAEILNGTLNYYGADHQQLSVEIGSERAIVTGKSLVKADVYGTGIRTWPLALRLTLHKTQEGWKISEAAAFSF